jgi:hypothetical protein
MLNRWLLVLLLFGLTGCVGSRPISNQSPESLAEVNQLLAGREARVALTDGSSVAGEGIAVFADSVRFATGQPALSTSRVRRITYERGQISPGAGAAGGAFVGTVLAGLYASTSEETTALKLVLGGIVVGGSALLGLLVGIAEQEGEQERVAYEGPVTRYAPTGVD